MKMKFLPLILLLLTAAYLAAADPQRPGEGGAAVVLRIKGPINPVTAEFISDGFEAARSRNARLIVLTMDTPGGLSSSMRTIIQAILASPIPVAAYVFPPGSRAASAGTYILYASHVAAMAPGTNLGAATPIKIGGGNSPLPGSEPPESTPGKDKAPEEKTRPEDAMTAKMVNDAVAYIRSLAEMRGRNADWAERSVREGASLPVDDALEQQVIEVVAADIPQLLRKLDGRQVTMGDRSRTLQTAGLKVEDIEPGWRYRLLAAITNPNIAFILLLVGVYGLIFEFSNPGTIGPGIIGVICLLLGLYALNVLPVNIAGLGLLLIAIALMVAEAFVPSFGVLGIGGLVAFVLAAMILFDTDIPGFGISWPVIAVSAGISGALLVFLLGYVWRAQRRPVVTGSEGLIGMRAEVQQWSGGRGYVRVAGERWGAVGADDLAPQDRVVVRAIRGLVLEVARNGDPPQT